MKTSLRLALALLPLAVTGTALAQTDAAPDHHGPRRGGPRGNPVIRAIDTDKNREISAAELANAAIGIRALDTNGDGVVSADELRPGRPAGAPERADRPGRPARPERPADAPVRARPVDPVMLALDANSDGSLNAAEIANATTSLTALDANKDGKLTLDEIRPLPPEGAPADAAAAPHGPRGGRGPRGPRS